MPSIPANTIVNVVPSVLAAGGAGVTGLGLMLSHNTRIPIGTVQSFASQAAMNAYFGATDPLAIDSGIYFAGFQGASQQPSALLLAQFPQNAVSAYLRGGNLSSLTLAQIQAINGTLNVTVDGSARSGAINLAAATSQTNAASLIQTALNAAPPSTASVTGSIAPNSASFTGSIAGNVLTVTSISAGFIGLGSTLTGSSVGSATIITSQLTGLAGSIGTYAVSVAQTIASESLTATCGLLTVTAVTSGVLGVGQQVNGTGVSANTVITQLGSGAGGTGTYYVNNSQTALSQSITGSGVNVTVTYDSISSSFDITSGVQGSASTIAFATGTAAAPLALTQATGAVLSQGAYAQTPAAFMAALITVNQAWANFMTHFDPDAGSGNTLKQQFAAWKNTALGGNRFGYFCWDPDASPAASSNAPASLGQILKGNGDSGTLLIWESGATADTGLCAFALGLAASINYNQTNGRATFAFKEQAGLVANVTDQNTASNLTANGYNFYGAYASAATPFIWWQNGQITGPFAWADSFEAEIWLNSFFQAQLLQLFANTLSVPFTPAGVSLIQQTCQTVINAGLAFGAFAPNTLTASQIQQVNAQAGANIAGTLQAQGYYLQVNIPSQIVQAARGPWPITFWYIDRNAVQSINLSSVMVQ